MTERASIIVVGLVTAVFALGVGSAVAAGVTVTDAKVQAGKLIVSGQTPSASQNVTLDGRFTIKSAANKVFSFALTNYLPSDCIVDLKAGTSTGSGVVANCGARGLAPRGAWTSATAYLGDDLVTYKGSSWRAKQANKGKTPATNAAYWEKFASKGATGARGLTGAQGPAGPQGPQGPAGPSTGPAGGALAGNYPNPTIADSAVTSAAVQDGAITSSDVLDNSLTFNDLATNSVGQAEIATDGVAATEIADDSIDSGEIVDFGLTNQDIGVLFAEVSATGTLDNSSGGVTVTKLAGAGNYEVDFGRNITSCTAVATIGPSGAGSAAGEINVADRSGNVEAVFVDTNNSAGGALDQPFRLIVVC